MRLVARGQEIRKRQGHGDRGKNRFHGCHGRGAVIRVVDVKVAIEEGRRIAADNHVGPVLAHHPHQVFTQIEGWLQGAVMIAQENHLVDATFAGRGALFILAQRGQALFRHAFDVTARVAAGNQHVDYLRAGLAPGRRRAADAKIGIVGVSVDDQRALGNRGFCIHLIHDIFLFVLS